MTDEWQSGTHRFSISGLKRYASVATDEHGRPVLLEIRMAKAGGVLRGLRDALAASAALGLQRAVPLSAYVKELALWPGSSRPAGLIARWATRIPPSATWPAGLGIEVNHGSRAARRLEVGRDLDSEGGLAGAVLLGYERDCVHGVRHTASLPGIRVLRKGRERCHGYMRPRWHAPNCPPFHGEFTTGECVCRETGHRYLSWSHRGGINVCQRLVRRASLQRPHDPCQAKS